MAIETIRMVARMPESALDAGTVFDGVIWRLASTGTKLVTTAMSLTKMRASTVVAWLDAAMVCVVSIFAKVTSIMRAATMETSLMLTRAEQIA